MSASNWGECPRCARRREVALAEREQKVSDAYGKVPVDHFDSLRAQLAADRNEPLDATFREDYEIGGAEEGVVKVRYRGACALCDLRLTFEHTHPLDVDER